MSCAAQLENQFERVTFKPATKVQRNYVHLKSMHALNGKPTERLAADYDDEGAEDQEGQK